MNLRALNTLEYNKILALLAEKCVIGSTAENAAQIIPSVDPDVCETMLLETDEAVRLLSRYSAMPISPISDLTLSVQRAGMGGILSMAELLNAGHCLRITKSVLRYCDKKDFDLDYPLCAGYVTGLQPNVDLESKILSAILDEETINDSASDELYRIRRKKSALANKARDVLGDMLKSGKYQKALQEQIVTMRGDRYVLPVKAEHRGSVPGIVHDQSASGQTLFIEPMPAVEINNSIRALQAEEDNEIQRILSELSALVADFGNAMIENFKLLCQLDVIFAKARLALDWQASCPALTTTEGTSITKGRHPLLPAHSAVPIDIVLGDNFDTLVITGPNTGGKTVALKTLGLFTLMAQSGLHIPAAVGSRIQVMTDVFADIGDEQSIEQSLSTFSSHMTNIVNILSQIGVRTLVLFDELGAGTDPVEGAALAIAILEYVKNSGALCAATTHYSEIKLYALTTSRVENAACEFDVETLKPTYRLLIGVPGKSNAFAISRRLGLGEGIIERAKQQMTAENARFEDVLSSLESSRKAAAANQEKTARELDMAQRLKEKARQEQLSLDKQRENILNQARREAKKLLDDVRNVAKQHIETIKNTTTIAQAENARLALRELREKEKTLEEKHIHAKGNVKASDLKLGKSIHINSMNAQASVLTLPDKEGRLEVQMGLMKVKVSLDDISHSGGQGSKAKRREYIVNQGSAPQMRSSVPAELDLRGQRVDEALAAADKYLDEAAICGLQTISLIHGKGTGALRAAINGMLKNHPHVASSRLGRFGEGETGVTIVEIK